LTAGRRHIFLFNMESGHQYMKMTSHQHPVPNLTMYTAGLLYFHSPQQAPSRVLNYEQGHVLHDFTWQLHQNIQFSIVLTKDRIHWQWQIRHRCLRCIGITWRLHRSWKYLEHYITRKCNAYS
jgi:hypothetical protein